MPASASMNSHNVRKSIFPSMYVRKQALRNILIETQILDEHNHSDALNRLEDVFKEADKIHDDISLKEKAINQDEVVLDSEVMTLSSKVIKTCGKKLTKELGDFSAEDFAEKLLRYVQNLPDVTLTEPNWEILERELPPFKNTANFMSLLCNLNRTNQKSQKQLKIEQIAAQRAQASQRSQRTRLDLNVAKKKPENVVQLDKDEKGVEETVLKIDYLIKNTYKTTREPINYYKLILDPDFGKTIENMLHVSFLCRDGHIEILTDNDLNLVVIPASKEKRKNAQSRQVTHKYQHISYLDMKTWQFLKDAFRLTEPMINF
ncbi:non-structural maintenance of chromosomes element 4 homolog A isoform X2 [Chelonus insularis]|uniref:non-structural maintenance of chromosomes element 4 homolog A isoform X2 n=1 Tax=Chelonus insularis TaxID=460826 RepID=UPI00158EDA80|nr:non-structural maintenance of chromosomes element 4 homolog A isoform X2 [Chelonus insularis]